MKTFPLVFFLASIFVFTACESSSESEANENSSTEETANFAETPEQKTIISGYGQLVGEEKALEKAEKMLEALGGREKWKNIKALNYVEKRDQKGIDTTYTYEAWMDMEELNLKLELLGTEFHSYVSIKDSTGMAYDLKNNRSADLRANEIKKLTYQDDHDMYKIIKKLAMGEELKLKMRNPLHFDVLTPDSVMLGGFNLNTQNFPEYFSSKIYQNGNNEKVMHYTGWKSVDGIFYPADGESIDRNMTFIMASWQPFMESLETAFPRLDATKTK